MKKKESEFLSWLLAQGCSLEGVKISRFEDSTGRGVQATRQIQAGEVLVKIPESLVITPDKSTASDALKRFGLGPSEFESPRLEKEALVCGFQICGFTLELSRWILSVKFLFKICHLYPGVYALPAVFIREQNTAPSEPPF